MDDWSEMRRTFGAYADFDTYMVKATVGKRTFKKRLKSMAEGTDIATVSDEALALLGVENGRRVWDDKFERSDGKIHQIRKDEIYPPEWETDIFPQYTRASKDDPSVERNTENKCWNEAGIIRFNVLRQLFQKDRTDSPDFKINWPRQARAAMKKTDGVNVGEDAGSKHIEANDDFQEGAATNPALNEARRQEGVADEETDEEEEGEETKVARGRHCSVLYSIYYSTSSSSIWSIIYTILPNPTN
jgi:hypothetical protein